MREFAAVPAARLPKITAWRVPGRAWLSDTGTRIAVCAAGGTCCERWIVAVTRSPAWTTHVTEATRPAGTAPTSGPGLLAGRESSGAS
jgi:hypothetical protein